MAKSTKHIVPHESGWAVKSEGRALKKQDVYKTKDAAIAAAHQLAKGTGGALVVHGKDGRIRDRTDYDALREVTDSNKEYMKRHGKALRELAKR